MNTLLHPNQPNRNEGSGLNVYLHIELKKCTELIEYFIYHKINFSLAYTPVTDSKPYVNAKLEISPTKSIETLNKEEALIQQAYEKYISNGFRSLTGNAKEIAAELNMSVAVFRFRFKKQYGKPFYQVYMDRRMAYAAALLKAGHTATAVSAQIGYTHSIKFNKMFQKHFGITPRNYQMISKDV